jgi:hypothetical protein
MHEDHEVSRRARRKDTLSAEDLGILLQWHCKYGTLSFPIERRRCELSLLKLWSSFTGSRPATLVANDNSTSYKSRESSADNGSGGSLADDSDGDTLVGGESELMAQTATPQTVCYRDINLFLLRNPDNPDRDILMAEVDFRNLKGRPVYLSYSFPIYSAHLFMPVRWTKGKNTPGAHFDFPCRSVSHLVRGRGAGRQHQHRVWYSFDGMDTLLFVYPVLIHISKCIWGLSQFCIWAQALFAD